MEQRAMARRPSLSAGGGSSRSQGEARPELPSISACFLVRFDQRVGYSIAWKRSIPGLDLDGVIEYKSLPSGLHNVEEDLIYFLYDRYAGLSSFMQQQSSEADRNVSFAAVGILLPLGYGRFGRGWLHAPELYSLVKGVMQNPEDMGPLEEHWQKYGSSNDHVDSGASLDTLASTSASHGHEISNAHPILFTTRFLDEVGPLVFPLYRAALLRQRIMMVSKPPLEMPCAFVYILSLLAAIPPGIAENLPDPSFSRILPLFTVGIHDMAILEKDAARARTSRPINSSAEPDDEGQHTSGWIACSSDEVLLTKDSLSDVRLRLPKNDNGKSNQTWPSMSSHEVESVKATQRDLRRYKALRQGLTYLQEEKASANTAEAEQGGDEQLTLLPRADPQLITVEVLDENKVIESQSWAAIIYDAYLWWASAGERSIQLQEEFDHDADLIFTAADVWDDAEAYSRRNSGPILPGALSKSSGALEMAVIAYFHRMTTTIIGTMVQLVELAEETEMDGESTPEGRVFVSGDDLVAMGLDPWSRSDREWVVKMIEVYFNRKADVQGANVECCGVRLY